MKTKRNNRFLLKTAVVIAALLYAGAAQGSFRSFFIKTFRAQVALLADPSAPVIAHTPLERISPVTKCAYIKGTAKDNIKIDGVTLYIKKNYEQTWSTFTLEGITSGQREVEFSFPVPASFIDSSIQYRIAVTDGQNTSFYPAGVEWRSVEVGRQSRMTIGPEGGTIILRDGNPYDGETSLEVPKGALAAPVEISITELDISAMDVPDGAAPALSQRPVAVYRFEPSGLAFAKLAKLGLLYYDSDSDGMADGTQYVENALKIFWWDGFDWRVLGTVIDPEYNTASSRLKHFCYFAVFPAGALTDDDYRPRERIITPALIDARNDFANFGSLGPGDTVTIFDVNGRKVRELKDEIAWDGKDNEGNTAESGIYVYQVKTADGKIISGMIVVAK